MPKTRKYGSERLKLENGGFERLKGENGSRS